MVDELVLVVGDLVGDARVGRVGQRLGVVEGDASVGQGLVDPVELRGAAWWPPAPGRRPRRGGGGCGRPATRRCSGRTGGRTPRGSRARPARGAGRPGGRPGRLRARPRRRTARHRRRTTRRLPPPCGTVPPARSSIAVLEHMIDSSGSYRLLQDVSPGSPIFQPVQVLITMPSRMTTSIRLATSSLVDHERGAVPLDHADRPAPVLGHRGRFRLGQAHQRPPDGRQIAGRGRAAEGGQRDRDAVDDHSEDRSWSDGTGRSAPRPPAGRHGARSEWGSAAAPTTGTVVPPRAHLAPRCRVPMR